MDNFDKVLSLNFNDVDIYGWCGIYFEQIGELKKVIEEFDKVL